MVGILLLLVNMTGSIGPTWGYFSPDLGELNSWIYEKDFQNTIGQIEPTRMVVGGTVRMEILSFLSLEASGDYYKSVSPNETRSLSLIPAEAYLTYKYLLFPVFLHTYVGAGAGMCLVDYNDIRYSESQGGFAIGPVVRLGMEFVATPRFAIEISGGWRFLDGSEIVENPDAPGAYIPLDLWGGYFRIALLRLLK
jgi:hypothetical protein